MRLPASWLGRRLPRPPADEGALAGGSMGSATTRRPARKTHVACGSARAGTVKATPSADEISESVASKTMVVHQRHLLHPGVEKSTRAHSEGEATHARAASQALCTPSTFSTVRTRPGLFHRDFADAVGEKPSGRKRQDEGAPGAPTTRPVQIVAWSRLRNVPCLETRH